MRGVRNGSAGLKSQGLQRGALGERQRPAQLNHQLSQPSHSLSCHCTLDATWRELDASNAFLDPNLADEEGRRLRMPGGE